MKYIVIIIAVIALLCVEAFAQKARPRSGRYPQFKRCSFLEVDAEVLAVDLQQALRDCGDKCNQYYTYYNDQLDLKILKIHEVKERDELLNTRDLPEPEIGSQFRARFLLSARPAVSRKIKFTPPADKCSNPWSSPFVCINPFGAAPLIYEGGVPVFRSGVRDEEHSGEVRLPGLAVGDTIRVKARFCGGKDSCLGKSDCLAPHDQLGEVHLYTRLDK